jgi:prefoldin subunit 5
MAELSELINQRLAYIDSKIDRIERQTANQIASLEKSKEALQASLRLITPQLEGAVAKLQQLGLLGPIRPA